MHSVILPAKVMMEHSLTTRQLIPVMLPVVCRPVDVQGGAGAVVVAAHRGVLHVVVLLSHLQHLRGVVPGWRLPAPQQGDVHLHPPQHEEEHHHHQCHHPLSQEEGQRVLVETPMWQHLEGVIWGATWLLWHDCFQWCDYTDNFRQVCRYRRTKCEDVHKEHRRSPDSAWLLGVEYILHCDVLLCVINTCFTIYSRYRILECFLTWARPCPGLWIHARVFVPSVLASF